MKYQAIKKKKDFQKILGCGKRAHAGTLTIVYLPAERTSMAVCVGKKHGKSVKRNRIKRLLREAFRAKAKELSKCGKFLLIPKVAESYSFSSFARDVESIFRREQFLLPRT